MILELCYAKTYVKDYLRTKQNQLQLFYPRRTKRLNSTSYITRLQKQQPQTRKVTTLLSISVYTCSFDLLLL